MKYEEIKAICHVRSSIFRTAKPEVRYPRNHPIAFDERVSEADKLESDWAEHDPRESSYEALA